MEEVFGGLCMLAGILLMLGFLRAVWKDYQKDGWIVIAWVVGAFIVFWVTAGGGEPDPTTVTWERFK